jgi:hypothetical protein
MHPREYIKRRDGSGAAIGKRGFCEPTEAGAANPRQRDGCTPPAEDETLLTTAQTRAQVGGVSAMCLWRWERDPRVAFPPPDIIINGRNYWFRGTIRRWTALRAEKAAV